MHRQYQYARRDGGTGFSITPADFARNDSVLKRRRQSPARSTAPMARGGGAADEAPPSIAMRARSKSKSRARAMAARPGMDLIALGTGRATSNTNKASYYRQTAPHHAPIARQSSTTSMTTTATATAAARGRSRSVDSTAHSSSRYSHHGQSSRHPPSSSSNSHATSRRSTAKTSTSASARPADSSRGRRTSERRRSSTSRKRSPSHSESPPRSSRSHNRRESRASSSRATGKRRERSASTTRACEVPSSRGGSKDIDEQVADAQREVDRRKRELRELQEEFDALRSRVDKKRYEVEDLELVLDGLRKRQELAQRFRGGDGGDVSHSRSRSRRARSSSSSSSASSHKSSRARSKSKARPSKRPCIVDEDDEDDDDDDVVIIDVKQEHVEGRSREDSGRGSRRSEPTAVPIESPPRQPPTDATDTSTSHEMPDQFWGRAREPKLLVEHRFKSIPDGSARKGRHLSVNPMKPSIFATSADEGGLILWNYNDPTKEISKVVTLTPSSFRHENSCAESIQWSPDGNRMAMAFRDPLDGMGEFCVVQLHQLKLRDSNTPQAIPKNRLTSKVTTLHPKGISAIDWVPTGSGTQVTSNKLVTTGGSDHAVVLWEEHEDAATGEIDFKWRVLHREHRSDIKALSIHSERSAIYTGGLDGLVVQYDVNKFQSQVVMERRKPTISRINAVLEHPHNPNLLLVSSLEQNEHNLLLRDLRERAHRGTAQASMNMTWAGNSTSQYIVPRWSPAGMHVSCGSKSGIVNIWDVRMRGALFPKVLPQQSLRIHRTSVVHACYRMRR